MAGVKISELPLVTVLDDADEILIIRESSSRRAVIASLVKNQNLQAIQTQITTLSTNTINVADSSTINLTYDTQNRTLSAEIGVLPIEKGGTGQTNFTENSLLLGNSTGALQQYQLSAGPGVTITKNESVNGNHLLIGTTLASLTTTPPVNTTAPVAWTELVINNTVYKMPLYI